MENWPQIPGHRYRILIIWGSGSGKPNSLFSLISQQPYIDKIYLYAKDPFEAKYQFLINKIKRTGTKNFNDSKAFIEYSNDMDDIYKNIEEYNPDKKLKILTVFDDMIADRFSNAIVTELFISGRIQKKRFKKITAKTYSFLAINATLASYNPSCLRKNLLERI